MKILVISDSDGGATGVMGEAIAEGAREVKGAEVKHLSCDTASENDLV